MTVPWHMREYRKSDNGSHVKRETPNTKKTNLHFPSSRGKYGEEVFGLFSTYFEGRPPKSVNLFWRRFKIADIPLDDPKKFDLWLRDQWYKKDALMEEYLNKGRFPPLSGTEIDYVETEVRTRYPWEILQIFSVVGICALLWHNVRRLLQMVSGKLNILV